VTGSNRNPNNSPVYQGKTGMQSKAPAMDRGFDGVAGNQQSVSRNATLPLGLGHYVRPGGAGAGDADPPLGVTDASLPSISASLNDGSGTTTIHPPPIPVGMEGMAG
jgi:hypothetical protein